jgi:predicted HTH domain antitoxin
MVRAGLRLHYLDRQRDRLRRSARRVLGYLCSVRYYSPCSKRLVIVIADNAAKIRKETIIVLKDEVGYVGLQRAAELLGMNQRAVRNLVSRRRLEAEKEGEGTAARLVVSLASVERLRLERQAAGKDSTA